MQGFYLYWSFFHDAELILSLRRSDLNIYIWTQVLQNVINENFIYYYFIWKQAHRHMDSPWPPWSGLWVQSKTAGRRRPCYNRRALTRLLCWSSWGPAGTGSWWGSTAGQRELPWWRTPWVSARRPRKTYSTPCVEAQCRAQCWQIYKCGIIN